MADTIPKEVKLEIVTGWKDETTWKVALFTSLDTTILTKSTYTECAALGTEVVGTGYTLGGATVAGRAVGYVDTDDTYIDVTDSSWGPNASFTAYYAVLYETTTNKIRVIKDFGANKPVTNGTFEIQWNSGGILKIS